jgi:phage-related protein
METLPQYLDLVTMSRKSEPNFRRTEYDDGYTKVMYNNSLMRETYDLTYHVCTLENLNAFYSWHRFNLKQGLKQFIWYNVCTGQSNAVRIIDGSISSNPESSDLDLGHEITFSVERWW